MGQQALTRAIPRRPRVGLGLGILLALGFALLVTPAIAFEAYLVQRGKLEVSPTATAAVTVRVPQFAGHHGAIRVEGGGVLVARGETFGRDRAAAVAEIYATTPGGLAPFIAYFLLCAALVAVYAHHLRRSNRGRLLRVQLVNLLTLAAVVVATKIGLATTSGSVLAVPVAIAAIVPTLVFDRTVGLATGVLSAIILSLLVPFDVGVTTVLVAQAATAGLLISEAPRRRVRATLLAGLASAVVAAFTYGVFTYLSTGILPLSELTHPASSGWVAATVGGVLAAVASLALLPVYQVLVGEITSSRLTQLSDLSHPLLRQIAEKSPGTWQHTLAMANMAEIAANAIFASGRLVRVGAYYHDLGKSLQPKYFIENLEPGEASPHERLPPEVSCDAIFAHVTEGLVTARRAKLHERVIDFMHMHHGNGVLEYFWAKCQREGNPRGLSIEAFRYPGVPPQSRETAILAIVDAVEAAARTLKKPDADAVEKLVQRIVYGKLHLGQLDESGLSMADLRRISDCLRETIRHAHHGRIEYPWQEEAAQSTRAAPAPGERADATLPRLEPPLDSLDTPRPAWHSRNGARAAEARPDALATTAVDHPRSGATSSAASSAAAAAALGAAPTHPADLASSSSSSSSPSSSASALAAPPSAGSASSPSRGRRGAGPPPAPPATSATSATSGPPATPGRAGQPVPLHGSPSEVAITAPHATQPQPDSSLARRIDAQLAALGDEFEDSPFSESAQSIVQPFTGSEGSAQVMTSASRATFESFAAVDTSPAMPSYPDDADVTSQQPLAEVEELVARSMEPSLPALRRPGETHEVDPDDIEADIEVAPPARRHASVVQRMPQPPKTAPSGKPSK